MKNWTIAALTQWSFFMPRSMEEKTQNRGSSKSDPDQEKEKIGIRMNDPDAIFEKSFR